MGDDLGGDVAQLAVLPLGGADEELQSLVGRRPPSAIRMPVAWSIAARDRMACRRFSPSWRASQYTWALASTMAAWAAKTSACRTCWSLKAAVREYRLSAPTPSPRAARGTDRGGRDAVRRGVAGERRPPVLRGGGVNAVDALVAEGRQARPVIHLVLRGVYLGRLGIGEHPGRGLAVDQQGDPGHVRGCHLAGQLGDPHQRVTEGAVIDEERGQGTEPARRCGQAISQLNHSSPARARRIRHGGG